MMKKRMTLLTTIAVIVFSAGVYSHAQDSQNQALKQSRFFHLLTVNAQETDPTADNTPEETPVEVSPAPESAFKPLKIKKGQIEYFLKIDGILGDTTARKHPNEIEIDSYSWGLKNKSTVANGGGGGVGKAVFDSLVVTMPLNKATPLIFLSSASGKHIKEAILTLNNKKTGQDFYKIKISDVLISSYKEATTADILPTVQVSLDFSKIELEYAQQKADGSLGAPITAGWDLKANKAL